MVNKISKPFREIVESDLSDMDKLQTVSRALDSIAGNSPQDAFLVDAICYAFERIDMAETQIRRLAELTAELTQGYNDIVEILGEEG